MKTSKRGKFYGVGVGPGGHGLITTRAAKVLKDCQIIFCPRAGRSASSLAADCIADLHLPAERFRTVDFSMDEDRQQAWETYKVLARTVHEALEEGKDVAYLTIGDALTYSTYGYLLSALADLDPTLDVETIPGVTSFASLAALTQYPLGQGKERLLILPCPDSKEELRQEIETHDLVILMKIGHRLPMVLSVIKELSIGEHCVLGSKVGLPEQFLTSLSNESCESCQLREQEKGYLSTMLIRKSAPSSKWLQAPIPTRKKEEVL
ncbi:MAG: precorrin-2 C(20)-methyltransferase [Candidatus Melainabacteria bacterium]|nr:precorrin-2 C(20)-methyltransferase [Candidatus Melainabacteria bacterium]